MSNQERAYAGDTHPLFLSNPAFWAAISPSVRHKTFARDACLFSHGDAATQLWLVHSGWVKLSRQTPDGKETIVGLCTNGEVFGEAALIAGASYPYTAEVVGAEARLDLIPASVLRPAIAKDSCVADNIMLMLNERMSQVQLKFEHMNTLSTTQRLGCFLLRLCHTQADGKKTLHIPVEKNVLAAYLGMQPETLSRSQQQLKRLGIRIVGSDIAIEDIGVLREFVCGSCSESGACAVEDSAG